MQVRRVKETDLEKLLMLYKHLHQEDAAISKEVSEQVWQEILSNDAFVYFVVEVDDLLVCSCNVTIIPNLTRGGRSIGLIENVITHSDYRHKGLGKAVIQTAIDFARRKDCYKVMLLSGAARKESHKFYHALGFSSEDKVGFSMKLP